MSKSILIPISFWVSALFAPAFSELPFSPIPFHSMIDSGIQWTLSQDYPRAITLFKEESQKAPENPVSPYFLLLVYESMMIDYETREWEKTFDSLYDCAERGFQGVVKREPENPWGYYFLGNLYAIQGIHTLRFSNYLNFTQKVFKGMRLLDKAIALDSTLSDAYLYPSLYQFAKAELFHYLPLLEEDRQESVDRIEMIRIQSHFSKEMAAQILVGIHCHQGAWEKAKALSDEFKRQFPDNRSIYWVLANGYLSKKEYVLATAEYDSLLPRVDKIPPQYLYNRLAIRADLARISMNTTHYEECVAWCDKILSINTSDERCQDFIRIATKLKSKALKKLGGSGK